VVRPSVLNTLTIIVHSRRVDHLIGLTTCMVILEPICFSAGSVPSSFQAATCALGGDGLGREPLADLLLWTATSSPSRRDFVQ